MNAITGKFAQWESIEHLGKTPLRVALARSHVSSRRDLRDKSLDPFLPPDSTSELWEH